MATERLSMRKLREILRHKWALGRSHRDVAASLGVSVGAVSAAEQRGRCAELDWATVESLTDEALELRLYGTPATDRPRSLPDPATLHTELKRQGVTLQLLHHEYREQHPGGYGYTQFCDHYRRWCQDRRLSMRQIHHAGEKLFVDYAGKKPAIADPATGEVREVELFVAVLGASNYTFAEATATQQIADWIQSHVHAFEYLGGVTRAVVPDQLKTGITRACRYEPELQRSYEELALHYGTVILPARPASPRDKAKVEVAVQIAERWILARLRHETFFSLPALNQRIGELLEALNGRTMRHYRASRRALFEQLDQPVLKALPDQRYQHALWKFVRANIDYHVELAGHYYSVPFTLRGQQLELRHTATTVEVFHQASASPRTCAVRSAVATPLWPSTSRRAIRLNSSGRPSASPAGRTPSARTRDRWSKPSSSIVPTPSRATAPVSASCGSPNATASRASRRPAPAPSPCVRAPTVTSNRS